MICRYSDTRTTGFKFSDGSRYMPSAVRIAAVPVHCRFAEEVALRQRMSAIGDIIQEHGYPHFICFQVLQLDPFNTWSHSCHVQQ